MFSLPKNTISFNISVLLMMQDLYRKKRYLLVIVIYLYNLLQNESKVQAGK